VKISLYEGGSHELIEVDVRWSCRFVAWPAHPEGKSNMVSNRKSAIRAKHSNRTTLYTRYARHLRHSLTLSNSNWT